MSINKIYGIIKNMGMEDHKLKVFCTVAETKSFSKTSEIIHLTQPAVSLQIQSLEETYETKLFDRTNNCISLTPSGEILYNHAKEILALYTKADKEIAKITGLMKGSITIGCSSTIGNYLIPLIIVDFKKVHPKIKISLEISNTKRIEEMVSNGLVDFGFVEADVSKQKLLVEPILKDELIVIIPPVHPWAKKRKISILELVKEPFILREEGSGTRIHIEQCFQKNGLTLNDMHISLSLSGLESIKTAVENGIGVSIMSRWAVLKELKYKTLKYVTLKEEKMERKFSLIQLKNSVKSHAVEEFLAYLNAYDYMKLLQSVT